MRYQKYSLSIGSAKCKYKINNLRRRENQATFLFPYLYFEFFIRIVHLLNGFPIIWALISVKYID